MNLGNKTFKNNKTGETLKVIDSFENIAVLESKDKIDVRLLLNTEFYTEQIDPVNFFNSQSSYNTLAEKIKNIPTDKIPLDDIGVILPSIHPAMNESAIVMTTEEDERSELAKKYGISNSPVNALTKQNEAFAKILGDDSELPPVPVAQAKVDVEPPIQRIRVEDNDPSYTEPIQRRIEDPIISIFRNAKRSKEFSIDLNIKDKIPRSDFIEMMEDSYELSIIDFLAKEFTTNLLKNPEIIENMIKEKIKDIVYNKKATKKVTKKPVPPPSQVIKEGKDPKPVNTLPIVNLDKVKKLNEGVEKKSTKKEISK